MTTTSTDTLYDVCEAFWDRYQAYAVTKTGWLAILSLTAEDGQQYRLRRITGYDGVTRYRLEDSAGGTVVEPAGLIKEYGPDLTVLCRVSPEGSDQR